MIATYTATLADKQILNDKFHYLKFELVSPNRIAFIAGQYLLLSVPTTPQKKSYSIVSAPSNEHGIELLVDISPGGPGSKYLESLQPGSQISFMAPVGLFTIADRATPVGSEEDALVFVATGSGIAPFKGMLEDLLVVKNDQRPITLLWGLRHPQDQFWFDEFSQLAEQHRNFSFHPTLSQPPQTWKLCRGRVTDCLMAHPFPAGRTGYYLCGSSGMIEDVKTILLQKGVKASQIHHEKFH